jgi:hypothetical protein
MPIQHFVFIILAVITLYSCTNTTSKKPEVLKSSKTANTTSGAINDTSARVAASSLNSESSEYVTEIIDTITDINFNELSVAIDRLQIYDPERKFNDVQKDTAYVYAEIGETIEDQKITIWTRQLKDVNVEQRFETSVTIQDEGPHCDLINWKHFDSEWKSLTQYSVGKFIGDRYSEEEHRQFPDIKIKELRKSVKEHCGDEWGDMVKKPGEISCRSWNQQLFFASFRYTRRQW